MNTIGRNASGEYLPQPPRSSKPPDLGALRLVIAKLSRRITLAEQTMSDLMDLVSNLHEAGMTRRPECSPPRGKRRCNTQVAESPSTADHM